MTNQAALLNAREIIQGAIQSLRDKPQQWWAITDEHGNTFRFFDNSRGDYLDLALPALVLRAIDERAQELVLEAIPRHQPDIVYLSQQNAGKICDAFNQKKQPEADGLFPVPMLDVLERADAYLEQEINRLRTASGSYQLPDKSAAAAVKRVGLPSVSWCAAMLGERRGDVITRWFKTRPDYFRVMLAGLVAVRAECEAKKERDKAIIIKELGAHVAVKVVCIHAVHQLPAEKENIRLYDYLREDTGEYFRVSQDDRIIWL